MTLDSGALIGFERAQRSVLLHLKQAQLRGLELTVPTPVLVEVWRGGSRSARIARLLLACRVEPLTEDLARSAGEAVGRIKRASVVDAVVMASAARRSDRVLTSDREDLERLGVCFPTVKLISI